MEAKELTLGEIVSLSKRRGFVYQSSEIYGGLKGVYDLGPLGVELKRNIAALWWKSMVYEREDIYGLDASILMHPKVWEASGHISHFSDPLVDCKSCKERFRADKAPKAAKGTEVVWKENGKEKRGIVGSQEYLCPKCGSCNLSEERQFNLMFRTFIGSVDPIHTIASQLAGKSLSELEIKALIEEQLKPYTVYLRPETAQAMFVQFLNVVQSMSPKVPFGIAQQGRSFRNEVTTEKFIFRTCEFEQMEMEYFVEPGTENKWYTYWIDERISWWRKYANKPDNFRVREHSKSELAHYSSACADIEYYYPWGWDELEGIASRTDYDLKQHAAFSGAKLTYFDPQKINPETKKPGMHYVPYVIEPAAGLTRAVLAYLCDGYSFEKGVDAKGKEKTRTVLKLHPALAPYKTAVFPLVKRDNLPQLARDIIQQFLKAGIAARYDEQHSIGKRYSRHDEIGTPFCITVDHQSLEDNTVTVRDRDTTKQERVKIDKLVAFIKERLGDIN